MAGTARQLEASHEAARSAEATAGPPPNDDCAGAEVIPGNGPFPFLSSVVNVADAGYYQAHPYWED